MSLRSRRKHKGRTEGAKANIDMNSLIDLTFLLLVTFILTIPALEQDLLAKVKEDPDVPVLVRGDERLTYGAVMDVVKLVYKCKVRKMALVTVEK